MKVFSILLLLAIFVGLPLYALNSLVLPAINDLGKQYAQAGVYADHIAGN